MNRSFVVNDSDVTDVFAVTCKSISVSWARRFLGVLAVGLLAITAAAAAVLRMKNWAISERLVNQARAAHNDRKAAIATAQSKYIAPSTSPGSRQNVT